MTANPQPRLRKTRSRSLEWLLQHVGWTGNECLIWPFARSKNGYGRVGFRGEHVYAHRKMCLERNGPPPSQGHEAAHICGNGASGCVNPQHLCWATRQENEAHKTKHGTRLAGTAHYRSHLSDEDVAAIRGASSQERGYAGKLAVAYRLHKNSIYRIRRGATYRTEASANG